VYDCCVLQTACQYFWSFYFSWGWVLPFSCFADCCYVIRCENLNRGASPSWPKLQVGSKSKYLGKCIQTLFLSLWSAGSLFPFSLSCLLICCGKWKLL
jgi:hypothetical protein